MQTQRSNMKILVMGGTGAMGSHLVELAKAAAIEVTVTSRTKSGTDGSVQHIQGNAKDDQFLNSLLSTKWDAIIDFMVYSTTQFQQRLPLFLAATRQYFFLSSARVYADSPTPISEDTPRLLDICQDATFLATEEYALAKAKQEDLLRDSGAKNWTIIRPYITYARERLQLGVLEKEAWLYRALKGRSIVFSRDIIDHMTTMTSGRDVARGILSLVGKPTAMAEAFHITSSQPHSWKRVLEIYLQILEIHLGKTPKVLLVDMDDFLRCHNGKYQVKYDRMFDRSFNTSKFNEHTPINSFTECNEGLRSCITEFLKQPIFKDVNWTLEAEKDRLTGEYTSLKEIPGNRNKLKYLLLRYLHLNFNI
jgi:nucleoside-diphosphate-sugar epimerase